MVKYKTFEEVLEEELKDPEFKKAWDDLDEEYQIINNLIQARINRNITQKELSRITGIDQGNISKIENAEYNPSLKLLKKLARGLGCRLEIRFIPIENS